MTTTEIMLQALEFARPRTLGVLEKIEKEPDPLAVLGWRPGPGRAHIGWQLMHVGVTEEIFATERLAQKPRKFEAIWPRFRGGSTPDDDVPSPAQIREVLAAARETLLATFREYGDARLDEIPAGWKERGLPIRQILPLVAWHEAHHQGQAHITLNLYKVAHPS